MESNLNLHAMPCHATPSFGYNHWKQLLAQGGIIFSQQTAAGLETVAHGATVEKMLETGHPEVRMVPDRDASNHHISSPTNTNKGKHEPRK